VASFADSSGQSKGGRGFADKCELKILNRRPLPSHPRPWYV